MEGKCNEQGGRTVRDAEAWHTAHGQKLDFILNAVWITMFRAAYSIPWIVLTIKDSCKLSWNLPTGHIFFLYSFCFLSFIESLSCLDFTSDQTSQVWEWQWYLLKYLYFKETVSFQLVRLPCVSCSFFFFHICRFLTVIFIFLIPKNNFHTKQCPHFIQFDELW